MELLLFPLALGFVIIVYFMVNFAFWLSRIIDRFVCGKILRRFMSCRSCEWFSKECGRDYKYHGDGKCYRSRFKTRFVRECDRACEHYRKEVYL